MKKILWIASVAVTIASCKQKEDGKDFVVKGKITNNPAKIIYLEYLPMGTNQRTVVDSAKISSTGTYTLGAESTESSIYNLRLDQNEYPFASVINDSKEVTVDANFNKDSPQFPEKYEVKNSKASNQLKDFMVKFNGQLQQMFYKKQIGDSLQKANASDSAIAAVRNEKLAIGVEAKKLFDNVMKDFTNPALTLFILGYYQPAANVPEYELTPLEDDQVRKLVNDLSAKFPDHVRLAQINQSLEGSAPKVWVGKPAPEIAMPDANNKEIKLSSFRGKYVLVDFWASWCGPCRAENPNVVRVFNKYKSKNFTILGVSLDRPGQKDKWLAAVMKDNLTWTQVSDLLEWQSPVVETFGFGQVGIPYNILVDPQGTIIAERLTGEALDNKLAEVLK